MSRGRNSTLRVVAAQEAPETPSWVPAIAHDVYRRVTRELASKGLLTDANRDVVEIDVSALAAIRRLNAAIDKDGATFREKGKGPRIHPAFAMLSEKEKQARMLASRLGLIEETREAMRKAGHVVHAVDEDEEFEDL